MVRKVKNKRSPNKLEEHLGAQLACYRRARNMSQTDLGKKVGVTFQQIQKYENGKNRLSVGRFFDICDAMDVDPIPLLEFVRRKA